MKPLAIALLALTACQPPEDNCTDLAAASVSISIVDADGTALPGTTVTYTVDGGPELEATCIDEACSEWAAGWEVVGEIVVTATYSETDPTDSCCTYTDQISQSFTIEQGQCHVNGEVVTLTLDTDARECDDTCS